MVIIPESCFDCCLSLKYISLPKTLKYICDGAFCCCQALREISLPDSLTYIGMEAFRQCYELKSIVIPPKIVGLSEYMFYDDYNLKQVVLPEGLTCIISRVFGNCSAIEIRLPQSLSYLIYDAFSQCDEAHIEVPKGRKEWAANIIKDVKDCITEYNPSTNFILTKDIQEKTKSFLDMHKAKDEFRNRELFDSLGLHDDYADYLGVDVS